MNKFYLSIYICYFINFLLTSTACYYYSDYLIGDFYNYDFYYYYFIIINIYNIILILITIIVKVKSTPKKDSLLENNKTHILTSYKYIFTILYVFNLIFSVFTICRYYNTNYTQYINNILYYIYIGYNILLNSIFLSILLSIHSNTQKRYLCEIGIIN